MTTDWELRNARADEAATTAALYIRTRRAAYAPFFPAEALAAMSVDVENRRWSERIGQPGYATVAALNTHGALAGFTHLRWQDKRAPATGEVEYMYVATEHQGRGLGAVLMAEAELRLTTAGMRDAILWVYEGNLAARGFYERLGWADDGGRRISESAPGQHLARYRKALG